MPFWSMVAHLSVEAGTLAGPLPVAAAEKFYKTLIHPEEAPALMAIADGMDALESFAEAAPGAAPMLALEDEAVDVALDDDGGGYEEVDDWVDDPDPMEEPAPAAATAAAAAAALPATAVEVVTVAAPPVPTMMTATRLCRRRRRCRRVRDGRHAGSQRIR